MVGLQWKNNDQGKREFKGYSWKIQYDRKVFLEALAYDLDIQYAIPNLFITKLTLAKYNEVNEVYRKLMKMNISSEQRGDKICDLLE